MTTTSDLDQLTAEDVAKARQVLEYCFEQGWTDGLPVVPAVPAFVDEFLAYTHRDPDEVIFTREHLARECTVRDAAVNALMAGCKPEYFPVFLAAMDCFGEVGSALVQSTTGQCQPMFVHGPVRQQLGFNCTENIYGSGDRPNATVGRAVRLTVLNTLDVRPHDLDQSTQGNPGKYSICIGENEEMSPWEPYHVEQGLDPNSSAVTMQMARSVLHVEHRSTQVAEEILNTIARSMSYPGQTFEAPPYNRNHACTVVMGPEHARIVAGAGYSKQGVREYLFERWGNTAGELRDCGKTWELEGLPDDQWIGLGASSDSIRIIVAGSDNGGVSSVIVGFVPRWATFQVEGT